MQSFLLTVPHEEAKEVKNGTCVYTSYISEDFYPKTLLTHGIGIMFIEIKGRDETRHELCIKVVRTRRYRRRRHPKHNGLNIL